VKSTEFDKFAEEYAAMLGSSIRASGEKPEYFADYKVRHIARHLSKHGIAVNNILDFGCGVGGSTRYFLQHLPNAQLTSTDVSQKSLDIAYSRYPEAARYKLFDGLSLPFASNTFDVVFTACVFHHIPADEHVRLLSEIRRVLRADGVFFVFEHNPLNPLTVRVVNQCPFDENAVLISAGELTQRMIAAQFRFIQREYHIFFPNFLKVLRTLEVSLKWFPLGAQYCLTGRK